MSRTIKNSRVPADPVAPACGLPTSPEKAAQQANLSGRCIAFVPEYAPLVTQVRRNAAGLDDPAESQIADLYLAEHPLPLAAGAVSQRNACTLAIGASASNILFISPPPGHVRLSLISWLITAAQRPANPASAVHWRESSCFDVRAAPAEWIDEALGQFGIGRSGTVDVDRQRLNECLQSEAGAAGQLFAAWPWVDHIKHSLALSGLDRPHRVATISTSLAARAYTHIYGTAIQVPYARASAGAPDWRH